MFVKSGDTPDGNNETPFIRAYRRMKDSGSDNVSIVHFIMMRVMELMESMGFSDIAVKNRSDSRFYEEYIDLYRQDGGFILDVNSFDEGPCQLFLEGKTIPNSEEIKSRIWFSFQKNEYMADIRIMEEYGVKLVSRASPDVLKSLESFKSWFDAFEEIQEESASNRFSQFLWYNFSDCKSDNDREPLYDY